MSEDLRYYFFDDEADGQSPIPPDEGWKQMHQLLDAELPLASKRKTRRYLFLTVAALTGFILLISSLPLQNYFVKNIPVLAGKKDASLKEQDNTVIKQNENSTAKINTNSTALINQNNTNNTFLNPVQQLYQDFNNPVNDVYNHNKNAQNGSVVNKKSSIINEAAGVVDQPLIMDTFAIITTIKNEDKEADVFSNNKEKRTTKEYKNLQLYAGAATNISFSNTLQGLQPYPFINLQYEFTPHFFAGASLALLSTVGSNANGIKKTVYVNDTSSNVRMYNEKLNYKRLSYADLSVTAGVKINKHVFIHGGVQFSRLLASKTYTSLEPYDFDMNTISMADTARLSPIPSGAPVYNNAIEAKKLDIRYVAGINYDFKKISLGLQYQAGIKPVLKGDAVTTDKNKMITLKAAYRFR